MLYAVITVMDIPGGLWRPPDVLPQEQVHSRGHHQQWQGVSNNMVINISNIYDGYKMSIMIMPGISPWYVQVWELPRPLHGRGQVTVQLTVC